MFVIQSEDDMVILDHSFVKDSARNIDYFKSYHFKNLLE